VCGDTKQETDSGFSEELYEGWQLFQKKKCAFIPTSLSKIAISVIAVEIVSTLLEYMLCPKKTWISVWAI
jgi:hypothetical protein